MPILSSNFSSRQPARQDQCTGRHADDDGGQHVDLWIDTEANAGIDAHRQGLRLRPGDELRVESEVLEVRPSKSRPDQGLVKLRTVTLNQDGDPVQISVGNVLVPRRPTP